MTNGTTAALIAFAAVYAALLALLIKSRGKGQYLWAKIACSLTFVAAACVFGSAGTAPAKMLMLLPGFALCAAGDVLLAVYNLHRQKWQLLAGMLVFLGGHCSFFAAFSMRMGMALSIWDLVLPVISAVAVLGLICLPGMQPRGLYVPIVVYAFVVALMCSKACALAIAMPGAFTAITALGALLAYASDIIILFLYFYVPTKQNAAVHIANLLTYYIGIFLMAAGMLG